LGSRRATGTLVTVGVSPVSSTRVLAIFSRRTSANKTAALRGSSRTQPCEAGVPIA